MDEARVPGTVEGNPVFVYLELFHDDRARVAKLEARCRSGRVRDGEVKAELTLALNRLLDPSPRAAGPLRPTDALVRITTTTICGTDLHTS